MYQGISQAGKVTVQVIAIAVVLDLIILFAALGQIALEGRSGYWNPFWAAQASFVVDVLESGSSIASSLQK